MAYFSDFMILKIFVLEDSLESMEEQKEAQKSPLTSSRKLSSSLHNLTLNREQLNKNGERFAFKICSRMTLRTEFFFQSSR